MSCHSSTCFKSVLASFVGPGTPAPGYLNGDSQMTPAPGYLDGESQMGSRSDRPKTLISLKCMPVTLTSFSTASVNLLITSGRGLCACLWSQPEEYKHGEGNFKGEEDYRRKMGSAAAADWTICYILTQHRTWIGVLLCIFQKKVKTTNRGSIKRVNAPWDWLFLPLKFHTFRIFRQKRGSSSIRQHRWALMLSQETCFDMHM